MFWRRLFLICLVVGSATMLAGPAPAGLAVEAERLEDEIEALRRVVPAQADDPRRLADFERRLGRLEEELRRLTGRIEEVEFGQRQLRRRFDQLVGDLDRRLGDLEAGVARADPSERGGEGAPDVAQRPAAAPAATATDVPTPDGVPSAEEGTLGSVPESAMLQAPRPAPETTTAPERGDLSPQEQYDAAMDLLRAGDYAGAQSGLELFLELHPDHPLAANAAYWLAESHYVRQNYAAAAAAFARNYRTYGKDTTKAADNLLKLGMSLQGLGESDKACLSFEELAEEFPDAPAHIKQALARERQRAECV